MRANLISQFTGLPNLDAFMVAVGNQLNDLDEFFGQLFTNLTLQNAVGAQLDNLGAILGQARTGLSDDAYRTLLQATISAYQSNGSVEALIQIMLSLGGVSGAQVVEGNTAILATVVTPVVNVSASVLETAVLQAKPAGVLLNLNGANNPIFAFDSAGPNGLGAGFDQGHFAGPLI
jgi:hypothetical protein